MSLARSLAKRWFYGISCWEGLYPDPGLKPYTYINPVHNGMSIRNINCREFKMKYLSVILFSIWLASCSYGNDTLQNTSLSRDSIRTILSQMNDVGDYELLDNLLLHYGWTPEIIQELSLALETCENNHSYVFNYVCCLLNYIDDHMPYPFSVKNQKVYKRPSDYTQVRSKIINTFCNVMEKDPYKAYLITYKIDCSRIDSKPSHISNWESNDRKKLFTSFLRSIQKY